MKFTDIQNACYTLLLIAVHSSTTAVHQCSTIKMYRCCVCMVYSYRYRQGKARAVPRQTKQYNIVALLPYSNAAHHTRNYTSTHVNNVRTRTTPNTHRKSCMPALCAASCSHSICTLEGIMSSYSNKITRRKLCIFLFDEPDLYYPVASSFAHQFPA